MFELVANNLGICMIAGAGVVIGVAILVDLLVSAFRSWEPILVDRGEIVDGLNVDSPVNVLAPKGNDDA